MKQLRGIDHIVIIDNGSDEVKRKRLKEYAIINHIKVIDERNWQDMDATEVSDLLLLLERNYGYAKANNKGLRLSRALGAKYYLLSNNDIVVENEGLVEELKKLLEKDPTVAVVGPRVKNRNGSIQAPVQSKGLFELGFVPLFYPMILVFRKFGRRRRDSVSDETNAASAYYPYYISGCFMLMDVEKLFEVELFDEHTFLFAEESILAERLLKARYRIMYYPLIEVIHHHMYSTSHLKSRQVFCAFLYSNLYYLSRYKGFGVLRLGFVWFGQNVDYWIWRPLRSVVKKLFFAHNHY